MPWNLLILPLVAGYYLLTHFNYFKFKQQRLDRQRLLFDSILLAIGLLLIAFTIRGLTEYFFPQLIPVLYRYFPIKAPLLGTAFSTLLIALVISLIGNNVTHKNRNLQIEKAIKQVGNEFELLILSSFTQSKLLEITLTSNKFYIAWAKELPIPSVTNYIRVIPAFSGFRDEHRRLKFTTEYLSIYAEYINEGEILKLEDLDVDLVISLANVVNISYFDIDMYERFNKEKLQVQK